MTKSELIKLAEITVKIGEVGKYTFYGCNPAKIIEFDNLVNSQLFLDKDLNDIQDLNQYENHLLLNDSRFVIGKSTLDTIMQVLNSGRDMSKVGVLNFASAYHAGGGFLKGTMAQEESLAYCSNLYNQLKNSEMYRINENVKTKMYTNTMVFSNVTFFRDSSFRLIEKPFSVNVLTSPAVNMREIERNGENKQKAIAVMKDRMGKILDLFYYKGCSTLVLGAFGCGVFKNDPKVVANMWKELLDERKGCFDIVIFSILDNSFGQNNLQIFKNYFPEI